MADYYMKIKVTSKEEQQKVISHLRGLGLDYSNPIPHNVYGIIVGKGRIGGLISELMFLAEDRRELTVEEVLNL